MSLLTRVLDAISGAPPPLKQPGKTGAFIAGDSYGSNLPIYFPDLYTAYKNSADVFRAVDVIAKSVGKKGYYCTDLSGKDDPAAADLRRFETFVRGGDGTGSIRRIIHNTVQALEIAGNFYWVFTKNLAGDDIVQWDTMLPQYVRLLADSFGTPVAYNQALPGRPLVEFEPSEVVHVKLSSDPEFELFGLSPLDIIIRTEVIADLAAAVSNRKMFENDQIPPIMYIFEEQISDDEIKALRQELKTNHSGANNRHRNLYLRGIKDVKPLAIKNMDAEFVSLRSLATEKVCAAYGVPKSILGYRDTSYGGSATASVMDQRALYELTIEPMERLLEDVINRQVLPRLGIDAMLFHFQPTSTEDIDKIHEYAREDAKNAIITANEARQKIGLDKVADPYADDLLLHTPQGAIRLGDIIGEATPSTVSGKQLRSDVAALSATKAFLDDLDHAA